MKFTLNSNLNCIQISLLKKYELVRILEILIVVKEKWVCKINDKLKEKIKGSLVISLLNF